MTSPPKQTASARASSCTIAIHQRPPPHSVEAEQGVLGSMLISPRDTIGECVEKINEEYFYVPAHQTIYTVLVELWNAGQAIDLITFTQVLRDRNLLESVGGAAFVTSLFDFVPTAANVAYYIDIVRDKYILRSIIAAATESVRRAYEEQDEVGNLLDEVESRAASIRSLHVRNGADGLTVLTLDEILALPTDEHSCLLGDRLLAKGQSLVIAGQPGLGKSRLVVQLAAAGITGREWCGIETHAHNGDTKVHKKCNICAPKSELVASRARERPL